MASALAWSALHATAFATEMVHSTPIRQGVRAPLRIGLAHAQATLFLPAAVAYFATVGSDPGTVRESDPEGERLGNAFCSTCQVRLPLRGKHCKECSRCIRRYDHHCALMGTCIGERNHCRFWWFLLLQTALCLVLAVGVARGMEVKLPIGALFRANWLPIALLAIDCAAASALLPLLCLHTYLAATNQTTWEVLGTRRGASYLRDVPANVLPFSKGVLKNLLEFCVSLPCSDGGRSYALPEREEMAKRATEETLWDNRYYTCMG